MRFDELTSLREVDLIAPHGRHAPQFPFSWGATFLALFARTVPWKRRNHLNTECAIGAKCCVFRSSV